MSSFKAYGKVNPIEQEMLDARRRSRRRIIIIALSSIGLVAIILGAVLGTTLPKDSKTESPSPISTAIKSVCAFTLYPGSCYSSLSQSANSEHTDPESLSKLSVQVALSELFNATKKFTKDLLKGTTDNSLVQALDNCNELLGLASDYLNTTLSTDKVTFVEVIDDVKTWLSASGTYQATCIDGFENATGNVKVSVAEYLQNSTEFTSNSLAIVNGIGRLADALKPRRLLSTEEVNEWPEWLSTSDRKLLAVASKKPKPDIIVAKDGSSKYKTIKAALKAVPSKSKKRFVIYVKKGVYNENVRVEKPMWNVMMYGDGATATIVSGSLNVIDGTPTFSTATFAVFGTGFIGMHMGFRNTAGAAKHQAVALMASTDIVVFYRCRMDAFQDTLYTHALRQFYKECDILGTVDFIFGNAAVVLQNCRILPRRPMTGQQVTITAQGKADPNMNTGTVIQNCNISPFGDLSGVKTYLGRPWKNYSTTIYMQTTMGSLIEPAGWLPWIGNDAPSTIFYSEFQNLGPGSSTKNRVKWKGLKTIDAKLASKFTVKSFISGDKWIPATGVPYKAGL